MKLGRQRVGLYLGLYAVMMVGLFIFPFDRITDRLFSALWNWLHFPAFVLLAALVRPHLAARRRAIRIGVWIGVMLLVPAIELVQEITGRNFAWADIGVGWAGLVVGGWLLPRRDAAVRAYTFRLIGASLLVLVTLAPTSWVLMDRMLMMNQFPVLATFSWPGERGRWAFNGVEVTRVRPENGRHGSAWKVVLLESHVYPGLFMTDLHRDWSRAKGLVIDVYLHETEPLPIWVRIDDREQAPYNERFQVRKELVPGVNRVRIEWPDGLYTQGGRPMTLHRIQEWGLFFEAEAAGRAIYLERAELLWTAYAAGYR